MDKGRSFSTIKVHLAAISACHVGFEGSTVGQHPLIRRFMKGARRSLPVVRRTVPEWDLSMVLEALSQHPFEPLDSISLKLLSLKTALLLALASAKRVSELHALSVHPSCSKFSLSGDKVFLKPNPAFMPKCFPAFTSEVLELSAFHPPPFYLSRGSEAERSVSSPCLTGIYDQDECFPEERPALCFMGSPSLRESNFEATPLTLGCGCYYHGLQSKGSAAP